MQIVASAFTRAPDGVSNAPIFVSNDGGNTWVLNFIVPSPVKTSDISLRFSGSGSNLYAGILLSPVVDRRPELNILRTTNPMSPTPMKVLLDRRGVGVDQPYVQAAVNNGVNPARDVVFVASNDFNADASHTATFDYSRNASISSPSFRSVRIESRDPDLQDAPSIRPTIHSDGTVYGVFLHCVSGGGTTMPHYDVVVVRDNTWGSSNKPFRALKDPGDNLPGVRLAQNRLIPWTDSFTGLPGLGQERVGSSLSIAVDPTNSSVVYVGWGDKTGADDYTLHLRRSTDRGVTWSNDLKTIHNATNPTLAVNSNGKVGFLYQQLTGAGAAARWVTHLERSADVINWTNDVLATVPANTPALVFYPYLGDYCHLMAVGSGFYGIFSACNIPDNANFPNGVRYQRNANFTTKTLFRLDNVTAVPPSIDPFFFKATD
jgi:hypothetical protein